MALFCVSRLIVDVIGANYGRLRPFPGKLYVNGSFPRTGRIVQADSNFLGAHQKNGKLAFRLVYLRAGILC